MLAPYNNLLEPSRVLEYCFSVGRRCIKGQMPNVIRIINKYTPIDKSKQTFTPDVNPRKTMLAKAIPVSKKGNLEQDNAADELAWQCMSVWLAGSKTPQCFALLRHIINRLENIVNRVTLRTHSNNNQSSPKAPELLLLFKLCDPRSWAVPCACQGRATADLMCVDKSNWE